MTRAAPDVSPSIQRAVRHWPWLVAGAAALAALVLLYLHQPRGQFFFPRCSFYMTTGLLCPGCGGLRAAHQLLHGHFLDALQSNALLVLGGPAVIIGWFMSRRWRLPAALIRHGFWGIFTLVILYSFLRNLPWAPFRLLAPP